jgi:hypothetical protein
MLFYNVDRFLNFSTSGYYVFRNQEPFSRLNRKSSPENEFSILFFGKDVPFTEVTRYFLTHDDSAQSRRNDRITADISQFGGQFPADLRGKIRVLQHEGTLEIFATVQPRAENKVAS